MTEISDLVKCHRNSQFRAHRLWRWLPCAGWTGSTTIGCSAPSGTSRRPKPRPTTMQPTRPSIWSHDSNKTASGKPGTLQISDMTALLCGSFHTHLGTSMLSGGRSHHQSSLTAPLTMMHFLRPCWPGRVLWPRSYKTQLNYIHINRSYLARRVCSMQNTCSNNFTISH